jgi:probable HAF family extracellular repeat protein
VLGTADTTVADTDYPNFNPFVVGTPDPVLAQAFSWQDGKLTDLGALPGNNSSAVFQVNSRGVGAGMSETGTLDPFTGWPEIHAVIFKEGRVFDLGTLPGGHESFAIAINHRGQVSGIGGNGVADPFASFFFGPEWTTQARSFAWRNGVMRDIGTLGGPDAVMSAANARGQIAGQSFTNSSANPATGVPTLDPFIWQHGHMRDLGTLGGTLGFGNWLNNRGEVAGQSDLPGDQASHPFLWDRHRLRDLGTFGGDFGAANYVNDAGHVVGFAAPPSNDTAHAFLWKHGELIDLTGAGSSQCTFASAINRRDQIVGGTCGSDTSDALLWVHGKQYDLNAVIAPSGDHLTEAVYISDRGQIIALGNQPNGNQRLFLLNPQERESTASASVAHRTAMGKHVLTGCLGSIHRLGGLHLANCQEAAMPVDATRCCR